MWFIESAVVLVEKGKRRPLFMRMILSSSSGANKRN